jgi:hypothetical protein
MRSFGWRRLECSREWSTPIRKVKAKEFVKDMRSGIDDPALMRKYDLTDKQLEMVFQKLIDADFITALELWERSRLSDTQITRAFVEAQKAIDELT